MSYIPRSEIIANQVFIGLPWKNVKRKYESCVDKLRSRKPLSFIIVGRSDGQAMRSQPFVDELKKRFPRVTQQQLLRTDIRYEWFGTSGERTYFVAFGVKDLSDFPDAEALIDFAIEYGKAEVQKLLPPSNARKGSSRNEKAGV